jgi:NAD(P)H-dependent flavin oxidoreductase YrpB (nitropropane dioxygenase family)
MTLLGGLGVTNPVVAAPMAGGPTTPELVLAAASAGSLGFLAGGYLSAETLSEQIGRVAGATDRYGVNLFAPHVVPVDPNAYTAYRDLIGGEAERYAVDLPPEPVEDDDGWSDKVDLLVERPAPVVSFTFGLPDDASLAALRRAGSMLLQTVTSPDEARRAAATGIDGLLVQGSGAGGHSGSFDATRVPRDRPLADLVVEIAASVDLPLVAAGGVGTASDVRASLAAGAEAVAVGTALLSADEAGTSDAHRAGLADHGRGTTVMLAFTGRPARGLSNDFSEAYDAAAPLGYPALHHLTRPIRRAAAAAGDPERVNLWAGSGSRSARRAPAAEILADLATRA